jgi:hypothetical protein
MRRQEKKKPPVFNLPGARCDEDAAEGEISDRS